MGLDENMKKKLKKGMYFRTEDNTILNCPTAHYNWNWGSYKRSRKWLFTGTIIAIIISTVLIFVAKDTRIQTIFSTFIGGLLGILVWIITTSVTDKINQEQAELDRLLYIIDRHIDRLNKDVLLENANSYDCINASETKHSSYYRFLWFLQNCTSIMSDKDIDSSKLILQWEDNEYSLEKYCDLCDKMLLEHMLILDEEHLKMVDWNFRELYRQLNCLRGKLLRYKTYISKSHPPTSYDDVTDKKHNLRYRI